MYNYALYPVLEGECTHRSNLDKYQPSLFIIFVSVLTICVSEEERDKEQGVTLFTFVPRICA